MLLSRGPFCALPPVSTHGCVNRVFGLGPFLRRSSSYKNLKKCYQVLGIGEDSSMKEVKEAFVELARKYHPDSGSDTASAAKFDEIKSAYESVRDNLSEDSAPVRDDVNEVLEKDFGIKHTVPQHRQYLSYDGVGHGTPTQRWQQYQQHRLQHAVDRVHDYRVGKRDASSERTLVLKDATLARQYKTTQAIERLVEDLIQESMARGEFNNLPGSGKPLKFAPENPYVDSTTRKLNEVLITNGYVPEWVMLEREIAEEKRRLRSALSERRSHLGPSPLAGDEQCLWQEAVRSLESAAAQINRKIDKFNMVVPLLSKQQVRPRLLRYFPGREKHHSQDFDCSYPLDFSVEGGCKVPKRHRLAFLFVQKGSG
ncbi:dnaJ homolog subfamily C member 28-like isoform X1 [Dermacentor silvarum]|uniref:dnaJ homolog subfamily C member 28-like isoform X1 n=1 Tax=Dermacentor silvarum TaxID=543639 RepID=UPI002101170E|nr:dnaJ homolog subfamily C member 28-like isoform X1 [Dermacentor silvarum]